MANVDTRKEGTALEYLKKHKILELLENITAYLVFERPGKYLRC